MKIAVAALCAAIVAVAAPPPATAQGFAPVELRANPIDQSRLVETAARFGALEPRGTLVLSSPDSSFSSWSGIDFGPDGTLYAVGDRGAWFSARLIKEDGIITGIADPMIASILDTNGEPVGGGSRSDAESLRIVYRDGVLTALVTFEDIGELHAFTAERDFAASEPKRLPLPLYVHNVRSSRGLESVAVAPADSTLAGATVLVGERLLTLERNHRAFILNGPANGPFSIRRSDDYDITDAVFLPDGDLLILERRLRLTEGFAMRIRRIAGAAIQVNAVVDGQVMLEADQRDRIDNMEGMAVSTNERGETLLTLISDDNHNSFLQHTILMQFAVNRVGPPMPRLRPQM